MSDFAHLHVHTEYSLLDGASKIETLLDAAKAKGMQELAVTDHGVMYGVVDFYHAAKERGIKPIIGCEVYVAMRNHDDKEPGKDQGQHHLVLLAENQQGYRNLVQLVSIAFTEGFYYKPRIDMDLLAKYHEGLIALSACLAGEIPSLLLEDNYGAAKETALRYAEVLGPRNFFLELQDHGIKEQRKVNEDLVRLSGETGIPLVATNDVHYAERRDASVHDIVLCIQTGKTLDDADRMQFATDQFYLKSGEEMRALFGEIRESLANTKEIAERCCVEFEFGTQHLPDYRVPEGYTLDSYLEKLCREKLPQRYPQADQKILERLEHEIKTIQETGFSGYFLIVSDLIRFAREKQIPVGPGRGSAAGSLVAYVLEITDIDPLKYDLLFERFLNPERVTMPDIDTDFCFERRSEIIDYVAQKYGSDHVAQIVTFGTMGAKAAIRDVGRVMGIPYPEVDQISKLVPNEVGINLEKALESPELKQLWRENGTARDILDTARAVEGLPRHASTHAAGVVISKEPLTNYVPLQKTTEGVVSTQFTMTTVEKLGLLKMDILGLRTLTVIGDTLRRVKEIHGTDLRPASIPLDDPATYEMLKSGESTGVFTFETRGMRSTLRNLRPERFEDLIALQALYRPGPLGSGMVEDFIARKHGEIPVEYLHPSLEPLLRETYGVILYQEQVMRIASELAGFSLGKADVLRRAMGKKKPEVIAAQKEDFITGALKHDCDAKLAAKIFDLMAHFAGYGFNKSHSAAYALVSYQTAFLKANYPVEFMASLLSSVMDNPDKVPIYMGECGRLGIQILPPDVNESLVDFSVSQGRVRVGLAAVKNVGRNTIHGIIDAREEGAFTSLQDFCERVDLHLVSKRVLESLIKCGAFNSVGQNRRSLLMNIDACMEAGHRVQQDRKIGQVSLFDTMETGYEEAAVVPQVEDFPSGEILTMEREVLGFYISGHPLQEFGALVEELTTHKLIDLESVDDGEKVVVAGIITSLRKMPTKKREMMAYFTLEDTSGNASFILFPKMYESLSEYLVKDSPVVVEATANLQENEKRLFCEGIRPINRLAGREEERRPIGTLLIKLPIDADFDRTMETVRGILVQHLGNNPVHLSLGNGSVVRVKRSLWVDNSDVLLQDLKLVCGPNNVELKN